MSHSSNRSTTTTSGRSSIGTEEYPNFHGNTHLALTQRYFDRTFLQFFGGDDVDEDAVAATGVNYLQRKVSVWEVYQLRRELPAEPNPDYYNL